MIAEKPISVKSVAVAADPVAWTLLHAGRTWGYPTSLGHGPVAPPGRPHMYHWVSNSHRRAPARQL